MKLRRYKDHASDDLWVIDEVFVLQKLHRGWRVITFPAGSRTTWHQVLYTGPHVRVAVKHWRRGNMSREFY